jgi:glycolate oxidase
MAITPLVRDLRGCLGTENVLHAPSELAVYDCDAFTVERNRPAAVVFPSSTSQVAQVVKVAARHRAGVVPRGAGTSLAGGCLPPDGGVVVMLGRMNRILEIDLRDRMALVEAGVLNLHLSRKLAGSGYHFAPDPSSQGTCTIGGNVATNAGGPHTLKYGVTVNHVLGVEAVTGDGSIVKLGPVANPGELDLTGVLVGCEGTLGIVTKAWVRLTPDPEEYRTIRAVFDTVESATVAVSSIIAAGIIPAAMELLDHEILVALEEAFHFGFPLDADAILIIEVDGPAVGLDEQLQRIVDLCRQNGAGEILQATSPEQRALLWKCRKSAAGAIGRISNSYCTQDGVVPRTKLPEIIRRIANIAKKHNVHIVNVAHAGDGNIHPVLLFDERDRSQVARVMDAGKELLEECINLGGSITAEHGVGIEKLDLMQRLFTPQDLCAMDQLRRAFDPAGNLNPGKVLPESCRTATANTSNNATENQ